MCKGVLSQACAPCMRAVCAHTRKYTTHTTHNRRPNSNLLQLLLWRVRMFWSMHKIPVSSSELTIEVLQTSRIRWGHLKVRGLEHVHHMRSVQISSEYTRLCRYTQVDRFACTPTQKSAALHFLTVILNGKAHGVV